MSGASFVFAHLADAHVGAWPRAPAVRSALRESVLKALDVAEERGAEFLVISGDLFHTPVPDPGEVAPVAAALRRLVDRGRRIYAIYGSHDYVAHRTSWLDVLAEAGVFVKVAPESIRAEGTRWTLPYLIDPPTGAVLAGISGRSHGLDRDYFRAVDSEAFVAQRGFKVFLFHAAVEEYLPEGLREHVRGIRRADLPPDCGYYAGGHIHTTYVGEGPGGGPLVNPGAVFGTSRTDLEVYAAGSTHRGVAMVRVDAGRAHVELVDTAPRDRIRLIDVDVTGRDAAQARTEIDRRLREEAVPGVLLFPKVRGELAGASLAELDLTPTARAAGAEDGAVSWDVRDLTRPDEGLALRGDESDIEAREVTALLAESRATAPWLDDAGGERLVRELVKELGVARGEGESKTDYETARLAAARRVLGLGPAVEE